MKKGRLVNKFQSGKELIDDMKAFVKRSLAITILGLAFFAADSADAMKKIPDGGSSFENGYDVNEDSHNQVDKSVYNKWVNGQSSPKGMVRGGKYPSGVFNATNGNNLIYDVYKGDTEYTTKRPIRFVGSRKGITYVTFDGWSILHGYHHHGEYNQATYIGLQNKDNPKDRRIYKAAMRNSSSANEDTHDKALGTCGPNAFNKEPKYQYKDACNMDYQSTQFRAYIPLDEVFEEGNEEWDLYLIKRVDDQIVYDELRLPFDHEKLEWNDGEVKMTSGLDHDTLRMTVDNAIRRKSPRGPGSGAQLGWFKEHQLYKKTGQDESKGIAVWYRVKSPHDGGENRWTSSTYWAFGGDIATLSWKRSMAKVTVQHIDKDTNEILLTEKENQKIGDRLTKKPKKNGYFKDKDGNPYVAFPSDQIFNEVLKRDEIIRFYYRVDVPDPSDDYKTPGTSEGQTSGKAFWELRRTDVNSSSYVYAESKFSPTGNHFAIRNIRHKMNLGGTSINQSGPISKYEDAGLVKGKNMQYEFSYEYTNFYRDIYECTASDEDGSCFSWVFVERIPLWDKGQTFSLANTVKRGSSFIDLKIDHRQNDVVKEDTLESVLKEKLLVGRSDTYKNNARTTKGYYETFEKSTNFMKSKNKLKTQTTLVIKPDKLKYSVELPSGEHKKAGFNLLRKGWVNGNYYPVDVDDSLKKDYKNDKDKNMGNYTIPLQQSELKDLGVKGEIRNFEFDFVSDAFMISEHTGFLSGYPYAEALGRHLKYGEAEVSKAESVNRGKEKLRQEFENVTGQPYKDKTLYVDTKQSGDVWAKLQRYYIPVSPTSFLKPNTSYTNKISLEGIGLNDVSWKYGQEFSFEHYLFGSGHDDAWIIEQPDPRVKVKESDAHSLVIKHKDLPPIVELLQKRPTERLHKFRVTDQQFVDQIKGVVGGF